MEIHDSLPALEFLEYARVRHIAGPFVTLPLKAGRLSARLC